MTSQDEKYIYFYKHDKCPALLLGYYNKKRKAKLELLMSHYYPAAH